MTIVREQIIWYPGVYTGRMDSEYNQTVADMAADDMNKLIELVQKRAQEDADWSIANGFVGNNEEKMRRMMAFVADETNIQQCVTHIAAEGTQNERTIDWVCRDLANASKYMIR